MSSKTTHPALSPPALGALILSRDGAQVAAIGVCTDPVTARAAQAACDHAAHAADGRRMFPVDAGTQRYIGLSLEDDAHRVILVHAMHAQAVLFDLLLVLSGSDVQAQALTSQVAKETRDDTPQALDAVWEEEQVKFLGEEGCASAQQAAHQRRFAGAVAPQYLDLTDALTGTKGR